MSRSTWTLGTPIRTDARLVEILTAIERQCVGEGLAPRGGIAEGAAGCGGVQARGAANRRQ